MATRPDGQPIFFLEQSSTEAIATAKVSTLDYFNKVLEVSGEQKLKEVQQLIQCNKSHLDL